MWLDLLAQKNITKLVFCGGIYYRIAVLGLFHNQHGNVIQKRITTNLSNPMICTRGDVPEYPKQGINQMGNFSKGKIRDAKLGSPDWFIYNNSF